MTQTDYCSYETSKLLKSVGYPQSSPYFYDEDKSFLTDTTAKLMPTDICAAPSLWDAIRWLREEKKLSVQIAGNMPNSWSWEVCMEVPNRWGAKGYEVEYATIDMCGEEMISTYESACDGGIQAACEYLLKKEKQ